MTKLILVRHCQAEGNLKRFFQGRIDSDITSKGREQIAKVAEVLSAEPIDELYCSSYQRARKTADGINLYHMLDIHIDDELAEIDAGDWEGKYLTDIEQIYPEQYSNWNNAPAVFAAPNGESMAQVYQRVSNALVRIISEIKGKTICIVSHGCAIKNMMCFAHGWDIDSIQQVPLGTNTAVNVVTFDDNMKPTVVIENYTDHLS